MKSSKRKLIPAIIVFLFGLILTVLGALFKIQHWAFASELLILGNLIEVIAILIAIVILIKIYKAKS
ncbi:hypothetical protein N8Z45_00990 [bacterium]|nr:hypothetical protein [bacterium]